MVSLLMRCVIVSVGIRGEGYGCIYRLFSCLYVFGFVDEESEVNKWVMS